MELARLGLIGDVHCEQGALELAITTLRAAGYASIVCTGDIPNGPGDINACCRLLQANRIPTVRGNHERWYLSGTVSGLKFATPQSATTRTSRRFLERLPSTIDLPTISGRALLCHGLGREDMHSIEPDQQDSELDDHPLLQELIELQQFQWILSGHSHRRMVRRYRSLALINAGTLRRDHDPCFAGINFQSRQIQYWNIRDQTAAIPGDHIPID
jgi:predicted phosphodiesterase